MRKITAGFKCDPELKDDLLREATSHGITLSEYLESICENRHLSNDQFQLSPDPEVDLEELESLRGKLYEYEEVLLGPLYEMHRNTEVSVLMPDGTTTKKFIESPADILETIIQSIKKPS
jgi:hypothetical protein